MMVWAFLGGIAAIIIGAAIFTIRHLVQKVRKLTAENLALRTSNEALRVELGQATSRLRIMQDVANKTPDELENGLGGGPGVNPNPGGGPISELRKPAPAPAGQTVLGTPENRDGQG